MHETSGLLRMIVEDYLKGGRLQPNGVILMRDYLKQWIDAPVWSDAGLKRLRRNVDRIRTHEDVERWLNDALREGHDPL
jgi:hypothetical protein